MTSLRPYLIRSLYEWILDNGLTPYLLVEAESRNTVVPKQFVQD
ncbi:MAG: ClpXP protease specificity-enhancing factor SspB, partial [Methylococcales bacterium]